MVSKETCFFYIFVAFLLFFCLKIYYESDAYNLKCVISTVDGNKYCVRDRHKLDAAADLLAKATQTCKELVAYMKETHPDDARTVRLVAGFNPQRINETLPTSELTAYTENKGEKLAFCLHTERQGDTLIDLHTLTFVAIHELTHVMTEAVGHGNVFWENFKFLLGCAKEGGIYDTTDYKKNPKSYCGMEINDNPYFDFN